MGRLMKGEFTTAVRTLQRNKGRSLLTMLGIIIGVASVVTVASIGQGVEQQVSDQTQRLGKDLITVRPGRFDRTVSVNDVLGNIGNGGSVQAGGLVSDRDILAIRKTPGVQTAIPLSVISDGVQAGGRHYNIPIIGSDAGLPEMLNQTLAYGSFFDHGSNAVDKVVLGSHLARTLFEQNVPLGQTVTILGHDFIVSGIFSDFQTVPFTMDADFNNAAFISTGQAQTLTNNHAVVYEVLVRPEKLQQTDAVVTNVSNTLLLAHGGQHDFSVLKQGQTIVVANAILRLLTALIIGVASISLLVGGVGIMNVMLVSVTERMHEIGIRKAVGATNRQILMQFMIEAGLLSVSGAFAGVVLSFIFAIILRIFTDLDPVITWNVVVIACLASVLIGVIFGTAPALKASRKEPIGALRNE